MTYAGKHCVRLDNTGGTACGIFQQQEWLAFRKGTRYAFRIWTKAETNQTLRLQVLDRPGFTFVLNTETLAKPGDWQLWSGEFVSPFSVRGARLQIQLVTPGSVRIGALSLMPADNLHGMRRDVVDLFKQLKPGCLRWPGGCFAEYYNWKDGLLPVDQRPPIGPGQWAGQFPDTDGYENHEIGTDEFIAICRELKAAPQITTRFNVGLPAGQEWLDPLVAEAGGILSQVQVGFYFGDATHEVALSDVVNTPTAVILPQLKSLRQLLDRVAPAGKRLGIGYYEWNVNWDS
ncbi:MAG: carbohydrate binding domain-containing protein [Verrucomicrobiota bacterium]